MDIPLLTHSEAEVKIRPAQEMATKYMKCEKCGREIQEGTETICSSCRAAEFNRQVRPIENEDYYIENGMLVFTEAYHLKRGFCCKSSEKGCRHCPYRTQKGRFENLETTSENGLRLADESMAYN